MLSNLSNLVALRYASSAELRKVSKDLVELKQTCDLEQQTLEALEHIVSFSTEKLESLMMMGLKAIYGSQYSFERVGKDLLINDGDDVSDLKTCSGGGLLDVMSLLVRITAMGRGRGGNLRTLLSDEGLRCVDRETVALASQFLLVIAEKLDMNILFVTQRSEFAEYATTQYRVNKKSGQTVFVQMGGLIRHETVE